MSKRGRFFAISKHLNAVNRGKEAVLVVFVGVTFGVLTVTPLQRLFSLLLMYVLLG